MGFSFYATPNYYGSNANWIYDVASSLILAVLSVFAVWYLICYIFASIGTYTIAKRRGIRHAWLAWIPVVGDWVLGCISDQYQYLVKGKNKSRRTVLMVLEIISTVLGVIVLISVLRIVENVLGSAAGYLSETQLISALMGPMMSLVWAALLASGVSIAYIVFRYIALYDLYISSNSRNGVTFLVLSIIFNVTEPFFIFACRNRDDGMPPRRPVWEDSPV